MAIAPYAYLFSSRTEAPASVRTIGVVLLNKFFNKLNSNMHSQRGRWERGMLSGDNTLHFLNLF